MSTHNSDYNIKGLIFGINKGSWCHKKDILEVITGWQAKQLAEAQEFLWMDINVNYRATSQANNDKYSYQ